MKMVIGLIRLVAILAVLLTPTAALADSQDVDNNASLPGLQNELNLTAMTGSAVNTTARLAIKRSHGTNNHLIAGASVTLEVNPQQTNLPAGYAVSPVSLAIPTPWNADGQEVAGLSSISFAAPPTAGIYSYAVKWKSTVDYGNDLTGAPALTIMLTVNSNSDTRPPVVNVSFPAADGNVGWFVTKPVFGSVTASDISNVTVISTNGAAISGLYGIGTATAGGALAVSAEGTSNITAFATDGVGNSGAESGPRNTATIRIDTVTPDLTITGPSTVLQGFPAQVRIAAFDGTSGLAVDPSAVIAVDTSTPGARTFSATAVDVAGNRTTATFTCTVWGVNGPFAPLVKSGKGTGQFKAGSTIPVKFQVTDGTALVKTATGSVAIGGAVAPFRWDDAAQQYIANVKTQPQRGILDVVLVVDGVGSETLCGATLR